MKQDPKRGIRIQELDHKSLRIEAFSDASFANNPDSTSQLGFIILLSDSSGRKNVLNFSSHKCRRVVWSVLGGEFYAFADAFDKAFILKHDLQRIVGKSIPLKMYTDSKSLFDVITKSSTTLEHRLMIDVLSVREVYQKQELSDIGFVRSDQNPANGFAKPNACKALEELFLSGSYCPQVEQWIIRPQRTPSETRAQQCETRIERPSVRFNI